MLVVATCIWDANKNSKYFSDCYTNEWVEKLYRGFKRNLTVPFHFVVFTDRHREFSNGIEQERLNEKVPDYSSFVEPYRLNVPMVLVGLDTIVTGNVDHLANYCMCAQDIALPRPFADGQSNNGVALVPAGHRRVFDEWRGENDMAWMQGQPHKIIDELFPTSVLSYKLQGVRKDGIRDARIIYFHGSPKPHQLTDAAWVKEHWI